MRFTWVRRQEIAELLFDLLFWKNVFPTPDQFSKILNASKDGGFSNDFHVCSSTPVGNYLTT